MTERPPLERHFASLDRITKLERDLAEAERQRDEARNDAAALGEEASRAWAALVGCGQDWQAGRALGSCVTEAERVVRERDDYTERYKVAMANGLRVIAERDAAHEEVRALCVTLGVDLGLTGPGLGHRPFDHAFVAASKLVEARDASRSLAASAGKVASELAHERDEARQAALRWEGNADQAEREAATHRRAAERCILELAEAQQSLRERTAEREALCERVSVLEAENARLWRPGETATGCWARHIHEAEERGARWALTSVWAPKYEDDSLEGYCARICAEARKAGEHG